MKGKDKEGREHLILQARNLTQPTKNLPQNTEENENQDETSLVEGCTNNGYRNSNNNANTNTEKQSQPKDGAGVAQPVGSSPRPSGAGLGAAAGASNAMTTGAAAQNQNHQPEITLNDGQTLKDDDAKDGEEENDTDYDEDSDQLKYRIFTPRSYEILLEKEAAEKKRLEEQKNNMQEGRLVDGQLKFGDEDEEEGEKLENDPLLANGSYLNEEIYGQIPLDLCNQPIEEIDPYLKEQVGHFINIEFVFMSGFHTTGKKRKKLPENKCI